MEAIEAERLIEQNYTRLKEFGLRPVSEENVERIIRSISELGNHSEDFPIEIDSFGTLLSGWHRRRVGEILGFHWPDRLVHTSSHTESLELALAANRGKPWSPEELEKAMRCFSRKEKTALVVAELESDAARSNSEVARQSGVDGKTVARIREELEATARIPRFHNSGGGNHTGSLPSKPVTTPRKVNVFKSEAYLNTVEIWKSEFEAFVTDLLLECEGKEESRIAKFRKFGAGRIADGLARRFEKKAA
jgi:hypothetical protein